MAMSIECILSIMADMQRFSKSDDELSRIISHYNDNMNGEIDEIELELVSAAQGLNYQNFLDNIKNGKK